MTTIPAAVAGTPTAVTVVHRIRVFVDYWNLQLTLNEKESEATGRQDERFKIDWKSLPVWAARKAAEVTSLGNHQLEGCIIFASYNPNTPEGRKFNAWASTWLNRQPGIQVTGFARHPRSAPKCNTCHQSITNCPHRGCGARLAGTVEKGVDTAIATDMIRLAWERAYDVAVLASSDADLVPAVKFLDQKGVKVVQAGFPPSGVNLATSCWASFDLFKYREEFRRP
jgi:uncharacterized LabA/DUF88 family protein